MRAPRGQNMVLLALTMLLVTLLVTMTIGLGLRIRQKHELQNLADAAAYSNAVGTARVFNNVALANRVEVSYWVAMAADQSLIDWTSYARAMSAAAAQAADQAADDCDGHDDEFHDFRDAMNTWRESAMPIGPWRTADEQAGREVLAIQGQIDAIRDYSLRSIDSLVPMVGCKSSGLTHQVLEAAGRMPGVTCVENPVSERELFPSAATGLVRESAVWNEQMREAAMGTRGGDSFMTIRGVVPTNVSAAINSAAGSKVTVGFSGPRGSAYWASTLSHGNKPHTGYAMWADDHGSVTVSAGDCSSTSAVSSHLVSTALQLTNDDHAWAPGGGDDAHGNEIVYHTMGPYRDPRYPGIWVYTPGFLPESQADAWGQPKLMVVLQRDLTKMMRFPWELNFTFGTDGPSWDGTAGRFPMQEAYATSMVYYHRHGQNGPGSGWNEVPNLLNPFWRATLVAADVDASPNDVTEALPPGVSNSTWTSLRVGCPGAPTCFKGVH